MSSTSAVSPMLVNDTSKLRLKPGLSSAVKAFTCTSNNGSKTVFTVIVTGILCTILPALTTKSPV